jgi:putative ABC transport system permease protein
VYLLWGLLVLAFLVASLGVVNTLALSVREQSREFGVLHALSLQVKQLRCLVRIQALLLGGLALVPGSLVGMALAHLITHYFPAGSASRTLTPDLLLVAGCWLLTLASAWLAALGPAARAIPCPRKGRPAEPSVIPFFQPSLR